MLKKVLSAAALGALSLSVLLPCQAAAPVKISAVAPVSDLQAEAELKIKAIEEALASDKSYLDTKATTLPVEAGVLAVVSQAIVESEEKPTWKASAPDLRDGAIAIATSKSYDDAKKGLEAVKAALGGTAAGAKPEAEWNKLMKLGALMKDVNKRNSKMRRATKKLPDDPAEAARDASIMAVLGLATHADTHEVKDASKVPDWQKYALDFQAGMTATSAALKAKDLAAAADAYKKASTACADCHGKFRENE